MKKIFSILLVLAIFLGSISTLTACNVPDEDTETSEQTTLNGGSAETEGTTTDGDIPTHIETTDIYESDADTESDTTSATETDAPSEPDDDKPQSTDAPTQTVTTEATDADVSTEINGTEADETEDSDDSAQTEASDETEISEDSDDSQSYEPDETETGETVPEQNETTAADTTDAPTEFDTTETADTDTPVESGTVESTDTDVTEETNTTDTATDTFVTTETETADVTETDAPEEIETTVGETEETEDIEETEETETEDRSCKSHTDSDSNDYCDTCSKYLIVVIDFYVLNDLHGKFCDTATQPGVDELGTYFANREKIDDNVILLSSGDMWQGTAESSLLKGKIIVEWMNVLGFVGMTLGNHEFDWGEEPIRQNVEIADFPFLAINVYDKSTGKLADYCTPSVIVERDGIKIGIIGAVGDSLSSVSSDMVEDVTFKVGSELTALVKAESQKLREAGADIIVYSLHDGKDDEAYTYDTSLSNGYVDIVFEAHTHQDYVIKDTYGVYHIQAGGENYGLSHIEISINSLTGNKKVTEADIVTNGAYKNLADHKKTEELEDKYSEIIDFSYTTIGTVSDKMTDVEVEDFVAQLYLEAGLEKWGNKYSIVLGGGFLRTRTPYNLTAGKKTYADIFSLFPFDNRLVLCSISGRNLKNRFIQSTDDDYHVALSDYGKNLNVSNNSTYYVVVDTYTALYKYNYLTIIEYFDETTFARDLLADAIKAGRLGDPTSTESYTLTSIADILSIGQKLSVGKSTEEIYYVKGTVQNVTNTTYGNFDLVDEDGNSLYIYGLKDESGLLYGKMNDAPKEGDVIVVKAAVYRYSSTIIEFQYAVLVE